MWSDRTRRRIAAVVALTATVGVAGADRPDGSARAADAGAVVTMDPFTVTAAQVVEARSSGARVACRLRVGVWEPHRPDAARFPPAVLGSPTGTAPGERWLDIRAWAYLSPVLSDRFGLCREKGFAAVEISDGNAATHRREFDLTLADRLLFERRLAVLAHDHDLLLRRAPRSRQ